MEKEILLRVINDYSKAFNLLDSYDHQTLTKIEGNNVVYKLKCDKDLRIFVRFILENSDFDFEYVKDDFAKNVVSRFVDSVYLDEDFKNEFFVKYFASVSAQFEKEIL